MFETKKRDRSKIRTLDPKGNRSTGDRINHSAKQSLNRLDHYFAI